MLEKKDWILLQRLFQISCCDLMADRKYSACITGTKTFPLNELFVFQFAVSAGINITFSACELQPVFNNCSLKSSRSTANKASAPHLKGGLMINNRSFS